MPVDFPYLSLIIACPVVGVLVIFCLRAGSERAVRGVALVASLLALAASAVVFSLYDRTAGGLQFVERYPWLPGLKSTFYLGVDGAGVTLVLLNAIVMLTGVITSFSISFRVKEYYVLFLLLVAGVFGSFTCFDFLVFFIFFEIAVLPMYLLIGIWGSTNKEYAALKLTLMLLAGSGLVFLGIMLLYFRGDVQTFDFFVLKNSAHLSPHWQDIIYALMLVGFGTLAALFPLHNWSPDGHVAAPTAVSMLHAGVLMKLGAYGVMRWGMELLPRGADDLAPVTAVFACAGVIYGAMVAVQQTDLKYMIGYSSVSHMNLVMLGLAAGTGFAWDGAIFQMFSHGIMTALFFCAVGFIYEQTHSRQIDGYGGLVKVAPWISVTFILAALAGIGLPGLSGFPAELMIFIGTYQQFPLLAIVAVPSLVFGAFYMLRNLQRVFFGPVAGLSLKVADMKGTAAIPRLLLAGLLVVFGLLPFLLFDLSSLYTKRVLPW